MTETHETIIAKETGVAPRQVEIVRALLDEGATIPFIARYRKEKTGSLNEVVLGEIRDALTSLAALDSRRIGCLASSRQPSFTFYLSVISYQLSVISCPL